jgi:hypothetical protein
MNMPNKINTTEVKNKFTKLKESLKKLLISKFNYFSIFTIIFGAVSVSEDAYAGNINQDDSSTTSYDDANDVIFTNAIAITVLAADDTVDTFTMTNNIVPVWAYSGGNDLKVIGAITNTASENLTVNMSGSGSEITLHELSVEGDANGQLTFSLGEGTIVEVTGIDTHIFDIIGAAASKGTFTITGATTMNGGAVGGANGLATINVAAAATFNKTVKAATVNAVAATTFLDDVTATSIIADATVNAQLTDAGTIAGDFTESATGDITSLIIKNSANTEAASITTFSGSIALDTVTIGTSTIGGAATFTNDVTAAAFNIVGGNHADEDSSVITTGDISSTAIVMASATSNAEASLTASGTAAQTIAGTINGDGTVVASGLEVTFSGAIGGTTQVAEVSIANTKAAIFDSTVDAVSLDVDGTATLKTAGNTIGEFELATTGALIIDKAIVDGDTLWTSATQADNTIALGKIYLPGNLSTGQTLKIADSNFGDDVADDLDLVMQDTALTNYKTDGGIAAEIVITATDQPLSTIKSELSIDSNDAKAILQLRNAAGLGADTTVQDLFTNSLNTLNSGVVADITTLAKQSGVQSDSAVGSTGATQVLTNTVQGVVSNRMASLRSGDAFVSGMSAGGLSSANSAYIQAIGSVVEQQSISKNGTTVFGYDTETTGVAVGFDAITDGGSVVGLSLSYSETEVIGLGKGKATNDIESYTASLYLDKTTETGYIEGSLTVGLNENSAKRSITASSLNRKYTSVYDSQQASLAISAGKPVSIADGDTYVTPFAGVTGTIIDTEDYTEKSNVANDAFKLKVSQDDVSSMVATAGIKLHRVSDKGTPSISLAINNEFGDTTINSTNSYTGGGSAFATESKIEELSASLGIGYSFGSDKSSINIGYEAEAKDDNYLSHYGSIKLVSKF